METQAIDRDVALAWLAWWQSGYWQQADASWHPLLPVELPHAAQQALVRQHARTIERALAIPAAALCPPQPLVLAITALSAAERQDLLALVAEICGAETDLSAGLKIWARRLSKGLRPGSWLPEGLYQTDGVTGSLRLLQALYPDLWPRLRLLFAQPAVDGCDTVPLTMPAQRLRPLWEAALWQLQQQSAQRSHVED
ncbi:serine kinase [Enterobacteriaceae bacterium]